MDRRGFLAGVAAAPLFHTPSLSAERASRRFEIVRGGDVIGFHTLEAVRNGASFEIDVVIRIAVKFLGITAYRYEMDNREVWDSGRIVSVDSRVNDDGDSDFCKVVATSDGLSVNGSRYSGPASAASVTTSYFAKPFLERRPWISTQSGQPLDISVARDTASVGFWRVSGELTTNLRYDDRGEWTGCAFDAGGEVASYRVTAETGRIAGLWADAGA